MLTLHLAGVLALTPLLASLAVREEPSTPRGRRTPPWAKLRESLKLLSSPPVPALLSSALAESLSYTVLSTYYTTHLVVRLGLGELEYSTLMALETVAFSAGSVIAELAVNRYEPLPVAGLGCAGIALSALTLHEVGELTALYVASLALGFQAG